MRIVSAVTSSFRDCHELGPAAVLGRSEGVVGDLRLRLPRGGSSSLHGGMRRQISRRTMDGVGLDRRDAAREIRRDFDLVG